MKYYAEISSLKTWVQNISTHFRELYKLYFNFIYTLFPNTLYWSDVTLARPFFSLNKLTANHSTSIWSRSPVVSRITITIQHTILAGRCLIVLQLVWLGLFASNNKRKFQFHSNHLRPIFKFWIRENYSNNCFTHWLLFMSKFM